MKPPTVSAFLAGDPVTLAERPTIEEVLRALGRPAGLGARPVTIAPGLIVLHQATGRGTPVVLRWVTLPPSSRLAGIDEPVDVVIGSAAPVHASGLVVQLLAELAACLGEEGVMEAARAATSRELLVSALVSDGQPPGEQRLPATAVCGVLETSAD